LDYDDVSGRQDYARRQVEFGVAGVQLADPDRRRNRHPSHTSSFLYQTILIAALFLGPFITLIGISNRALRTRLFLSYFISGPIRPGDPLRALGWKQGGSLEKQNQARG
jgi:hypothetical protein